MKRTNAIVTIALLVELLIIGGGIGLMARSANDLNPAPFVAGTAIGVFGLFLMSVVVRRIPDEWMIERSVPMDFLVGFLIIGLEVLAIALW